MEEKLLNIFNTVRKNSGLTNLDQLEDSHNLKDDLELDSISIAELIASIDVAFEVDINSNELIQSVADVKKSILEQQK